MFPSINVSRSVAFSSSSELTYASFDLSLILIIEKALYTLLCYSLSFLLNTGRLLSVVTSVDANGTNVIRCFCLFCMGQPVIRNDCIFCTGRLLSVTTVASVQDNCYLLRLLLLYGTTVIRNDCCFCSGRLLSVTTVASVRDDCYSLRLLLLYGTIIIRYDCCFFTGRLLSVMTVASVRDDCYP